MKLDGRRVIGKLLGLAEGESALVDGTEWTSLGDTGFEVTADFGEGFRHVERDDLVREFKPARKYEVVR